MGKDWRKGEFDDRDVPRNGTPVHLKFSPTRTEMVQNGRQIGFVDTMPKEDKVSVYALNPEDPTSNEIPRGSNVPASDGTYERAGYVYLEMQTHPIGAYIIGPPLNTKSAGHAARCGSSSGSNDMGCKMVA